MNINFELGISVISIYFYTVINNYKLYRIMYDLLKYIILEVYHFFVCNF